MTREEFESLTKDERNALHFEQKPYKKSITWITGNDGAQIAVRNLTVDKMARICAIIGEEPCDDCISRQAVLDLAVKIELPDSQTFFCISPEDVEALPHVTPKHKMGQWIKHNTGHSTYYDCSLCGCAAPCTETADKIIWKMANYCPDCGAKMENDGERWR